MLRLALRLALALFAEPATWGAMQRNAMKQPVGWEASAAAYARLYDGLLE